jgi:serine/threonine protein kinase
MTEKEKKIHTNKVKNRILDLSQTVKDGLERECTKEDFYSEEDEAIGKGGFGRVWKVRHKDTDKVYVIKVMCKQNIISQKMTDQINREIEIMYRINHPHIIKLINHFEDDENLYLIMELGAKGQLFSLLNKFRHGFDQIRAAQYMREIISAVKYLHSFNPPIIHRDIKPENILLDENGRCKLADFGWSNYVMPDNTRRTFCGTPEYLAPEMVNKKGHDTSVDIWALGVLCFELLTGKLPFRGKNTLELFSNIGALNIKWP